MTKKQYIYDRPVLTCRFNLANPEDKEMYEAVRAYMQERGIKQPGLIRQAFAALLGKRTIILDQEALNEAVREALK